jgi:CDP-2,3-bis-(O-geranylgeranyl)-sn-glycerol synthase
MVTNKTDEKSIRRNTKIAKILTFVFIALLFLNFIIISLINTWADWIALLIFSLLFIVPGYLSNAGMVIVGGGKPIDGGKVWRDGRRIFGEHKTWNGLIKGPLLIGIPISFGIFLLFIVLWPAIQEIPNTGIEMGIYQIYSNISYYEFYFIGGPFPLGLISLILRIILTSYGAAFGDLLGSFLKRRFNIASGEPFWIIDQIDFATISILFAAIPFFFIPNIYLGPDVNVVIFLLILTPAVSVIANTVAYFIGLKEVPW